jgi:rhamnulokinase
MEYYLAVDIGASSGRHVLGCIQDGVIKTQEIYRFKNGFFEENGHKKWDTEYLFQEIINGLKKAKELGKIPQSVGIDTWGVDYALLDKEDKLIDGVYAYRDSRTDKTVPAVHQKVPFAELYKRTGIAQASYNTVYQLYDDLITGRMKKAKTFLMLPDYLHFLLTGVKKQEYSNATTTGLVNAKTKTWDFGTIAELGYKQSLFQTLYTAGDRVGKIKKEIAEQIGYETQVILPPTHDTSSAILGAPIDTETLFLSSGTCRTRAKGFARIWYLRPRSTRYGRYFYSPRRSGKNSPFCPLRSCRSYYARKIVPSNRLYLYGYRRLYRQRRTV